MSFWKKTSHAIRFRMRERDQLSVVLVRLWAVGAVTWLGFAMFRAPMVYSSKNWLLLLLIDISEALIWPVALLSRLT